MRTVYLGDFNAERFWNSYSSPSFLRVDLHGTDNVVLRMDELLSVLCKQDDILITRYPFNKDLANYLHSIGISFSELSPTFDEGEAQNPISQILLKEQNYKLLKKTINKEDNLTCFAVTPHLASLCKTHGLSNPIPSLDVVKRINSKSYSHQLADKLTFRNPGRLVHGVEELLTYGRQLLRTGKLVIKTEHGVSGNGTILITSEAMLCRMAQRLSGDTQSSSPQAFLIQPFLERQADFSCQFFIRSNGEFELISTQGMINKGFSYLASFPIAQDLQSLLLKMGYYEMIECVSRELWKEGYYGPVCVDSLLLANNEVIPMLEINARMSMGFLNHSLMRLTNTHNSNTHLTFLSLGHHRSVTIEEILYYLNRRKELYSPSSKIGFAIPLSANTLSANNHSDGSASGRLYFALTYDSTDQIQYRLAAFKHSITSLGFKILN